MNVSYLYIALHALIILNILSFVLGFCVGRLTSSQAIFATQKPKSFFDKQSLEKKSINIDDKKYVVPITSNFEKKYEELGETKNSQETINSSVNKLKSLKK